MLIERGNGMSRRCALVRLGQLAYDDGLILQQSAWNRVAAGDWDGILLLLEHRPVITLGRTYEETELLQTPEMYREQGIELVNCNRGGKTTCHNPGQLVGYPILNLSKWQQDSHWYLRTLEQVVINTVQAFGLSGGRREGYTGAWTGERKIAAIGVNIRRWITSHGFALNVNNDLRIFSQIVPCGIREFPVTSMAQEGLTEVTVDDAAAVLAAEFAKVFACSLIPADDGICHI